MNAEKRKDDGQNDIRADKKFVHENYLLHLLRLVKASKELGQRAIEDDSPRRR